VHKITKSKLTVKIYKAQNQTAFVHIKSLAL